jgi:hypothetical protein
MHDGAATVLDTSTEASRCFPNSLILQVAPLLLHTSSLFIYCGACNFTCTILVDLIIVIILLERYLVEYISSVCTCYPVGYCCTMIVGHV